MPGKKISRNTVQNSRKKQTASSQNPRPMARMRRENHRGLSVGDVVFLIAKDAGPSGAVMEWGRENRLPVPVKEQQERIQPGKKYLVKICSEDGTGKMYGSTRIAALCDKDTRALRVGQQVDLVVHTVTAAGIMAVANNRYYGRIRLHDTCKRIFIGDTCRGYVLGIHGNGTLELGMRKPGYAAADKCAEVILYRLKQSKGFIPCHDKSSPEEIRKRFSMSKKEFKRAVGNLYKKRMIELKADGIGLAK